MDEVSFLNKRISEYYFGHFVDTVPSIAQREFGIGEFGKKISGRHLAFKTAKDFNSFLVRQAPFFVSFSPAYYSFPAAKPMEAKKMLKSDLVYEFDADDIQTDCKMTHDSWSCTCGQSGKGNIDNCTSCGLGVKVDQWVCNECLGETKKHLLSLVKVFESELGISGSFFFNYSGFKGYHIHVRSDELSKLSSAARIEIVDYLSCTQVDTQLLGFSVSGGKFFAPHGKTLAGLSRRLVSSMKKMFVEFDAQKIAAVSGISFSSAKKLEAQKEQLLSGFDVGIVEGVSGAKAQKFWSALLLHCLEGEKIALDRQTSVDMKKIIRVPATLHGSTGLLAKPISADNLSSFSPLDEAVVFSDSPIKLKSVNAPRFYLGGNSFGPFSGEGAELPEYAAIYLLCRKSALLDEK